MFQILISNTQSLKFKIISYEAVKCSWRRVQHKLMDAQVVVDAQFEDTIGARICPGDYLKRARLFNTRRKRASCEPRRRLWRTFSRKAWTWVSFEPKWREESHNDFTRSLDDLPLKVPSILWCVTPLQNEQVVSPDGDCHASFHEKLEFESVLSPNDEERAIMTSREVSTTFPSKFPLYCGV